MHKMPCTINGVRSRLPTAPTEEQSPIQNINSAYSNAVIPKKKKANQLNHYVVPTLEEFDYDCAIIHVGINKLFRGVLSGRFYKSRKQTA